MKRGHTGSCRTLGNVLFPDPEGGFHGFAHFVNIHWAYLSNHPLPAHYIPATLPFFLSSKKGKLEQKMINVFPISGSLSAPCQGTISVSSKGPQGQGSWWRCLSWPLKPKSLSPMPRTPMMPTSETISNIDLHTCLLALYRSTQRKGPHMSCWRLYPYDQEPCPIEFRLANSLWTSL